MVWFFSHFTDESESHVGNFASGSLSDDDFQPAKKRLRTPGNQVCTLKHLYLIVTTKSWA